jgi:hypothetical protein
MNVPASPTGRAHWIALAALVILAAGIGVAVWQSRPARAPALPPVARDPAPGVEPGEQVIEQALRQAPSVQGPQTPIDSTAIKERWLDEVRGVDVAGLDPERLELFVRFANAQRCTCGCGYTLAGCRASDMTCGVSGPRLEALLDSIRAGRITSARGIRARPTPAVDSDGREG